LAALLCASVASLAAESVPFDAAAAFGARESVTHLSLSPEGTHVAYVTPTTGQGAAVFTLGLSKGSVPKGVATSSGKPDRLNKCDWVSDSRLVCGVYGVVNSSLLELLPFTRLFSINADGSNIQILSSKTNAHSRGLQLGGGSVIDWTAGADNSVLMTRIYLPDDHIGTRIGSKVRGLGVDRVDTSSLAMKNIEPAREDAVEYISDGYGTVRLMVIETKRIGGQQESGILRVMFRTPGSSDWVKLGDYDEISRTGFWPVAVDRDRNIAYGFDKKDGRLAVFSMALDGSMREELVLARPDVDVDELIRIGRHRRVVGASYATDRRHAVYFDPAIEQVIASLSKALPGHPSVNIEDASSDESKLLIFAGSDNDPGVYYLFDRTARQVQTFLVVRSQLEGVKLATVQPISYPAADGTPIPGYLTLPPGKESAKGLPAIVLPHGGPNARDEWGFDWLSQFYASRGYAVLQPNFRGSVGYGDAWFQQNGFRAWPTAVGDVLDAGRWLVSQGIADPAKLGILGWSYGGYAALQSAVTDPGVFRAVVAIAPVTDLEALKEEHRQWSDFRMVSDFVGDGPQVREGSPAQNAQKIKVPVLLFHGAMDRNVGIAQSKEMASRLAAAGAHCDLVTWPDLDHYLEDAAAREEMLRRSDAFLRESLSIRD
jgi:dienelactone hydrolase